MSETLVPMKRVEQAILALRGHKVVLDADLAARYGVETKVVVRAVKRNKGRFPTDFMFQLSQDEFESLRFHFGTSNSWGGRRSLPYTFAEQGVAMLSSVLRSPRADGPAGEGAACPRRPDERLPLSLLPVPAAPSGFRVEEGRLGYGQLRRVRTKGTR